MSLISVHIVTHNSERVILKCLQSLVLQRNQRFSTVVVDNNSNDKTVSIARAFDVSIIENVTNKGYAAAHNQAIKITKSSYILTLNPDVILHPDFLRNILDFLSSSPRRTGSVCGQLLRSKTTSQSVDIIDSMGMFIRKNRRQGLLHETLTTSECPKTPYEIFGPDGAAAVYSRKMLEDISVNGEIFDEHFFMHKEDLDVNWRAQLRGWNSYCVPTAQGYHTRTFRPGNRSVVPQRLKTLAVRNRYLVMLKNDSWENIRKHFFYILFYELGILGYILMREQRSFSAYFEVLKMAKKMYKKRKIIQRYSKISPQQLHRWFQ